MPNIWSKKSTQENIDALALVRSKVVGTPNNFGFTDSDLANAHSAQTEGATALARQQAAAAELRASTEFRQGANEDLVATLNHLVAVAEGNNAVSDEMLRSIGFAPRRGKPARQVVPPPATELVATPSPDGSLRLSW